MTALLAATAGLLISASPVAVPSFPARSGERGILDVPDGRVVGEGGGLLGAELRFDRLPGSSGVVGPLPLYVVASAASRLDLGLTMREWGQPGDPLPAKVLFGAAAKLALLSPEPGPIPAIALSAVVDRINERAVAGARLAASSEFGPLTVASFAGWEMGVPGFGGGGATAGAAASLALGRGVDLSAEAITGPRGGSLGGALRWAVAKTAGVGIGANYLPDERGLRVSLTLALVPAPKRPEMVRVAASVAEAEPEVPVTPEGPRWSDARPRFRLRVPVRGTALLASARHLQHGPRTESPGPRPGSLPGRPFEQPRSAAPTLEDLAETQLREQQALADARERRVRAAGEQLDQRERAADAEAATLADSERDLAAREAQIDARERRLGQRGASSQQQRQLESLEAQLASQERSLSAQERSYVPALDAAQGRERDAAAREDAERQEASRLASSASAATTRALQLEIRKQSVGARNRQLSAAEARLVARGERIDALERQLRLRAERLDAWGRRLDTRTERLDLLERPEARPPAPAAPPAPTGSAPPREEPVFVMVVKSPTAIVQERATAPASPGTSSALHPGVAVEKAVAAATVVMFPTPATQLSELDREAIDNIAKLAAKERCELLIWARAKDPGLMAEAQRRAGEIRTRVLASGPLDSSQVVTRITTRPGAMGVDVVVSALREAVKAAAPAGAPAEAAPSLLAGESGKRQVREAVVAAQKSIEACVAQFLEARNLARAEGVLKISVSERGTVSRVAVREGDLSGTQMEECLGKASAGWLFPPAGAEYVVDVPITVIRGGKAR